MNIGVTKMNHKETDNETDNSALTAVEIVWVIFSPDKEK